MARYQRGVATGKRTEVFPRPEVPDACLRREGQVAEVDAEGSGDFAAVEQSDRLATSLPFREVGGAFVAESDANPWDNDSRRRRLGWFFRPPTRP